MLPSTQSFIIINNQYHHYHHHLQDSEPQHPQNTFLYKLISPVGTESSNVLGITSVPILVIYPKYFDIYMSKGYYIIV
jgi:hypothetical protein